MKHGYIKPGGVLGKENFFNFICRADLLAQAIGGDGIVVAT